MVFKVKYWRRYLALDGLVTSDSSVLHWKMLYILVCFHSVKFMPVYRSKTWPMAHSDSTQAVFGKLKWGLYSE